MKPYPKYKDSGVEWIGNVPEGWEMEKVSHAFSTIGSGTTPIAGNPEYHNEGITPWINTGDLNNGILKTCSKKITNIAFNDYSALKIYPIGSLIIAMYGATIGKVSILDFTACTNQACCVLSESKKWNVKYVFYWFIANKEHIVSMSYGGGQPNISQEIIKSLRIPLPERNEQYAIITYLDRKTVLIDNLISKKQKFIVLLKEERAAIINQAVTKGLNPDAPMKDSGIEWLGEIPAHWEVKKLKYIARITLGKMLTNVDKGSYYYRPYLRAQNINWEKLNIEDVKKMWFSKDELRQYRLNKNDLLVSEGGEAGRTAIWDEEVEECYIQNSVHKVTMKSANDPFFFLYTFCLLGQKGVFESVASRISIAHLTKEKLKETVFPVPPNDEQERISKFISAKTTKNNQTISKIAKQIDLLQEYRTALISEVVTGKIDVRDEGLNG